MSRFQQAGWWLFLLSAGCFLVAGIVAGDPWVVGGSLVFGVACVLFLADGR
ncbi:MAG: hypothetical protein AB1Z57_03295 [Acidimicrobiia bacterium]